MSTKPPTLDVSGLMQFNLHVPTSTIFLEGEVAPPLAGFVAKSLHVLDLLDQPITVYLSTKGGCRTTALGIYDLLRACRNEVRVIGYGDVLSAGSVILQGGDVRLLMPNSCVMIHPGWSRTGSDDMDENTSRTAKMLVENRDRFYSVLAKAMGLSLKEMLNKFMWDTYLSAPQAVKLGLADAVLRAPQGR